MQQQRKKTWSGFEELAVDLRAIDLRQEAARAAQEEGIPLIDQQVYRVTIFDESGTPFAEKAEALYLPQIGRLGIAWGAPATWADVESLDDGIDMWLNRPDEWEQRN